MQSDKGRGLQLASVKGTIWTRTKKVYRTCNMYQGQHETRDCKRTCEKFPKKEEEPTIEKLANFRDEIIYTLATRSTLL